jgi:DNA helicase HerA-like ATPase
MANTQQGWKIGYLRSGSKVLEKHLVSMPEGLVGNRLAVFAQSGFGKTNAIKVILWGAMNQSYGKLIFDRRGEYVPNTSDEQGDVWGLVNHPNTKDKVVLFTNRDSRLGDSKLRNNLHTLKRFVIKVEDIPPVDLIGLHPNMTNPQREFLYVYEGDPNDTTYSIYSDVLAKGSNDRWDESNWNTTLADWFGNKEATQKLDYSAAIVVRSIRKKLATMSHRPFIDLKGDGINELFEHLRAGRTVVIDLSGYVSERDRTFVATLITRKLFNHNLKLLDSDDSEKGKIKTVIFFEEAQTLLSSERISEGSIFVDVAKEGRALEIGLVAVTQQPSAISTNILSQFNSFIALHLEFTEDIQFLKKVAGNFEGLEMDLRRKVPGHAYLVTRLKPFAIPLKVFHFNQYFLDTHARQTLNSQAEITEG